jgi:hypothetical protein
MSTKKQQIIDAVEARLKTIIAGGQVTVSGVVHIYKTNVGERMNKERLATFTPAQLPALNIWPGEVVTDDERSEIGRPLRLFDIIVDCIGTGKPSENSADIELDVMAAVGSDPRWGGLARWTNIRLGAVSAEEREKYFFGVPVVLEISYRTTPFQM